MPGGSGGGMPGSGDWTGLDLGRFFPGRGLAKRQLNHPARRISLRSASARLNSTRTTDHASALQRVWSITRRTGLMRRPGVAEAGVVAAQSESWLRNTGLIHSAVDFTASNRVASCRMNSRQASVASTSCPWRSM
jgi:hypothetical protein